MRRMVKERLFKFDATPLFPERRAYAVPYKLSDGEAGLYREVTDYVREEFNRAEALQSDKRAGTVGFALTILQRRLASSPEAIYQSLRRRKERLESRLRELQLLQRGSQVASSLTASVPEWDDEFIADLDEAPDEEIVAAEEEILDRATAARTVDELQAEIQSLRRLESLARAVRVGGEDKKWQELSALLNRLFTAATEGAEEQFVPSPHQKLVIFTEHRDTLNYLHQRITTLLGRQEAVVMIHGGIGREDRRAIQDSFLHDPEVLDSPSQRCCLGGDQPPAGPSDGELRPALEPEPHRAKVRAHSQNRADRGLSSLESDSGGDQGGRCLSHPAGEA